MSRLAIQNRVSHNMRYPTKPGGRSGPGVGCIMAISQLQERRLPGLIGLLGVSGILHLVMPKPYERIVPPQLGSARRIVFVSGVAELGCAAMLAVPQTRRRGALASAALF